MNLNPFSRVKGFFWSRAATAQKRQMLDAASAVDTACFETSCINPTTFYEAAFIDFHRKAPKEVREHRAYFSQERRGFGEDAFHTMWWRLVSKFKPRNFLEIGVYRGQVISLVALLAKLNGIDCRVTGISPFSSAADSVSKYLSDLDYYTDTLANFKALDIEAPQLLKAYSTDPVAIELIRSQQWDMIYIDGNHDYEVVVEDWKHCSEALRLGGVIVLDDAGLGTAYHPPKFATAGHPGPSRLAAEIDTERFKEILQVGHNRVFQRNA